MYFYEKSKKKYSDQTGYSYRWWGLDWIILFQSFEKNTWLWIFYLYSLFENNSIEKIEKKIKELLDEDVFVICVFDAQMLAGVLMQKIKKWCRSKNMKIIPMLILCDSLQSIEYWFLLHFEDTCRHFQFCSNRKSIKAISANIR